MLLHRRQWLALAGAGIFTRSLAGQEPGRSSALKITSLKVTPIALPDPPILAAGGCHGPYFLRNIVEIGTDAGITGIAETKGGQAVTTALEKAKELVIGKNVFAHRSFAREVIDLNTAAYTGIELACLDACGHATGRRLCELLGGPVRDDVEFAAYLFFRYAADHPTLLTDKRIVDGRGKGSQALDDFGEVRTADAMVKLADRFHRQWGFRVMKLKGGVLPPDLEVDAMKGMHAHFKGQVPLRIDPNARWKVETAIKAGKQLKDVNLEYYEDPVGGQAAMAQVRKETGLAMATNMCVTRFNHFPDAVRLQPVDVILADHHYWGGLVGCQEMARVADTFGWRVGQHSNNHAGISLAAMTHLAAVIPQLTYASDTHYPWLPEGADVIAGPNLKIQGGKLKVPAGPGIGVALDRDKLARAHETYVKCGMRERDDGTTMRMIEPSFERAKQF